MSKPNRLLLDSAKRSIRAGKLLEAERICVQARTRRPLSIEASLTLSMVRLRIWGTRKAEGQLRQIIRSSPPKFDAYFLLAKTLYRLEHFRDAIDAGAQAEKLLPADSSNVELLQLLGACHSANGSLVEAERSYRQALALGCNSIETHRALAAVYGRLGRPPAAVEVFKKALTLDPVNEAVLHELVAACIEDSDAKSAREYAERILAISSNSLAGHLLLSQAVLAGGDAESAERYARRATQLEPVNGRVHAFHASTLQVLGEQAKAEEACLTAIRHEPNQGLAYFNIVRSRRIHETDDSLVRQMEKLSTGPGLELPDLELLEYALGKSLEDLGRFEQSITHYVRANEIAYEQKYGSQRFDQSGHAKRFEDAKRTFTAKQIESSLGSTEGSAVPIFIVGMMRSGTTLVEQILSRHPDIAAGGEIPFWLRNREYAVDYRTSVVDTDRLAELRHRYQGLLDEIGREKPFVTDKMPSNYMQLGLIAKAYPNAKFIHAQRDPADTCLSIYFTQNTVRIPWAHNRENIAIHYRRYLDLMRHWRTVLPTDRILTVQYEDLVSNPGETTKELLKFCGLPWVEECLNPEGNQRAVSTPSLIQVRQPIYTRSVNRSKPYEQWVSEFTALRNLDQAVYLT